MWIPSDNDIKYILKNKDQLLYGLKLKRISVYKDMQDSEAYMRSILLQSPSFECRVQQSDIRDITIDFIKYQKRSRVYEKELKCLLMDIAKEEEIIKKIWYCFTKLPEPYYTYLKNLYIDGKSYKVVQAESGLSKSSFARYRKRAIETIQMLYDYHQNINPSKGDEGENDF